MLEGERATPAGAAAALAAMTLSVGRRVIIVEGAERWREGDVEEQLAPALTAMPAETTLAMFAREESRAKAPKALHDGGRAGRWSDRRADDGEAMGAAEVGPRAGGVASGSTSTRPRRRR